MAFKLIGSGLLVVGLLFIVIGGFNILDITGHVTAQKVDVQDDYDLPPIVAGEKYNAFIFDSDCPKCTYNIANVEQFNYFKVWEQRVDPNPAFDRPMLMLGLSAHQTPYGDMNALRIFHSFRAQPVPARKVSSGTPQHYRIFIEQYKGENHSQPPVEEYYLTVGVSEKPLTSPTPRGGSSGSSYVVIPDDDDDDEDDDEREEMAQDASENNSGASDATSSEDETENSDEQSSSSGSSATGTAAEIAESSQHVPGSLDLKTIEPANQSPQQDVSQAQESDGLFSTVSRGLQTGLWWGFIIIGLFLLGLFFVKQNSKKQTSKK